MIVISTHNHNESLKRLLDSIYRCNLNEKILVVDTASSQRIEDLRIALKKYDGVIINKTEKGNYETGAYIHAYMNYIDDGYLFLQDSVEVIDNKFMEKIYNHVADRKEFIFPWLGVYPFYQSYTQEHYDVLSNLFGETHPIESLSCYAFCCNIFYSTRKALDRIKKMDFMNYFPTNKMGSQCTEQIWALWAHKAGIECIPFSTEWTNIWMNKETPLFKKYLLGRN